MYNECYTTPLEISAKLLQQSEVITELEYNFIKCKSTYLKFMFNAPFTAINADGRIGKQYVEIDIYLSYSGVPGYKAEAFMHMDNAHDDFEGTRIFTKTSDLIANNFDKIMIKIVLTKTHTSVYSSKEGPLKNQVNMGNCILNWV